MNNFISHSNFALLKRIVLSLLLCCFIIYPQRLFAQDLLTLPLIHPNSAEGKHFLSQMSRVYPEFPRIALKNNIEATLVTQMQVDRQCKISNIRFIAERYVRLNPLDLKLAEEIKEKFRATIFAAIKKWLPNNICELKQDINFEQYFSFRIEETHRDSLSERFDKPLAYLDLIKFTLIPKGDITSINTTEGSCPLQIGLTMFQPIQPNRLRLLSPEVAQNQKALFEWLSALELIAMYKDNHWGRELQFEIPCAVIPIK